MAANIEQVIWTLCPNGMNEDSGALKFSLFASPRLTALAVNSTVDHWVSTWADWPARLAKTTIGVQFMTSTGPKPIDASRIKQTSRAQSDVYSAIFAAKTPVLSHSFTDLRNKLFISYPIKALNDTISGLYANLGLSVAGDDLPKANDLLRLGFPAQRRDTQTSSTTKEILAKIKQFGLEGAAKSTPELLDLFSFYHTPMLKEEHHSQVVAPGSEHEPAHWKGYAHPDLPTEHALERRTDFHKIAAGISNFHELSRLCGLVIDFEIAHDTLPPGPYRLQATLMRKGMQASIASGETADICPITRCTLGTHTFDANIADPNKYKGRFLSLTQNSGIDLVQMDVDGAAHKLIALGHSLPRMTVSAFDDDAGFDNTDNTPPQPDAGAATLRSAGLMLAKSERHKELETKVSRSGDLNDHMAANPPVNELMADDITRGYRVDIIDLTQPGAKWQSLCRRIVDYGFINGNALSNKTLTDFKWSVQSNGWVTGSSRSEEEGSISLALTSSADDSVPDVYKLHEGLFVWRGWSLCAPEPFQSLRTQPADIAPDTNPQHLHHAMVGESVAVVPGGMPLSTLFRVAKGSLPALRFGHQYQLRVRTVDLCGNSVAFNSDLILGTVSEKTTYRRYEAIEAPVLTLLGDVVAAHDHEAQPEQVEVPLQGESIARMALRTYDGYPGINITQVRRNVAPPRVTQRFAETHGVLDDGNGRVRADKYDLLVTQDKGFVNCDVPAADWLNPKTSGDYKGETTRYSVSEQNFSLPYLPDPYAIGICIRWHQLGDVRWPNETFMPLYSDTSGPIMADWPNPKPVMIVGREDYTHFEFISGTRTLQVPMPKGCRHRLRLSCVLPPKALDNMAVWDLIKATATTAQQVKALDSIRNLILKGQHWMFTPWREIEMIHAVQKPLKMPAFDKISLDRSLGELDAVINISTPLSGRSTARLDLNATWNEPEDNAIEIDAKSAPLNREHAAHVSQTAIARLDGFGSNYSLDTVSHPFPDTRYRRVKYRMEAVTRFKEFFETAIRIDENQQKIVTEPETQWVRNSAPPPAPGILYVIPTFGWFRTAGNNPGSKRTGGVRVYLDRPWMVTGYNEMLAVILPNPDDVDFNGDTAANRPFVTQWGRDPIRVSADITTNSPKSSTFRLAKWHGPITYPGTSFPSDEGSDLNGEVFKRRDLPIPGQEPKDPSKDPPNSYAIAPHQVGFDPVRQLWYADIVVTLPKGSYFPFLRLAVARYQPMSVDGAHLSSAVTCDFLQLSPDRIAVVVPMDGLNMRYGVFIYGDQPISARQSDRADVGSVSIQTQVLDAGADPVLGWRDAVGNPPKGPMVDYSPNGLANKEAAEAQLEALTAKTADQIAAQLSATSVGETTTVPLDSNSVSPKSGTIERQMSATSLASTNAIQAMAMTPHLIHSDTVYMPLTPSGGKRRILITETETYPRTPENGNTKATTADRIVYAEAIEI